MMSQEDKQNMRIILKNTLLTEALSNPKFLLEFMEFTRKYDLDAHINYFIELLNKYYEERNKALSGGKQ